MTAAAIYARYSSDFQRDASIEDQIRLCKERAKREGWRVDRCYTDHGVSGASLMRPGIQALLQDAQARKFKVIVAEALDRLSRGQADIATIYERLRFAGVRIVTLAEGDVEELHIESRREEASGLLRSLIDRVVLTLVEQDGRRILAVDLKGHLAAILALATKTKKPPKTGGFDVESAELVAGGDLDLIDRPRLQSWLRG